MIVSPYPLGPIVGGVEAVTSALVSALNQHTDVEQLNVVTFVNGSPKYSNQPLGKGYHHLIYSQERFELISKMAGDKNRLRILCDSLNPEIVHAQGLGKEGIVTVQQAFPSVVTIHGLVHVERRLKHPTPTPIIKVKMYLADRLVDLVLARARLIISTSQYDKKALASKVTGQVVSIPNPVPIEFFNTTGFDDARSVLFAGVVQPRKNIAGIVRAFAKVVERVPRAQLRLVGPTPFPEYLVRVNNLINTLKIENNVMWLGHISQEQLLAEYAKCTLCVMFSEEETSPMAVAQAMAIGKPVVASNVGGIPDMIIDNQNGYLIPKDNEGALADRLIHLLLDENLRRRMGQLAKESAHERSHPKKVAEKTLHAYQSILHDDQKHIDKA